MSTPIVNVLRSDLNFLKFASSDNAKRHLLVHANAPYAIFLSLRHRTIFKAKMFAPSNLSHRGPFFCTITTPVSKIIRALEKLCHCAVFFFLIRTNYFIFASKFSQRFRFGRFWPTKELPMVKVLVYQYKRDKQY